MMLSLNCLTSLYLMLTSYLQQIVNYSYIQCILVTTHLDCLRCTTRNTIITTEITSPITAIANNAAKAMFTPLLSSELLSVLVSVEIITLVADLQACK